MERLTEQGYKYHSCDFMDDGVYEWVNRLSAYEDTGLMPPEIMELKERDTAKAPVWKKGRSTICKDYADGHGEVVEDRWADWVCPNCGWFVGEQYIPRRHNQQKSNYCS